MLEIYYNSNINIHASTLKKCIPDLDTNYENRIIRKNDKIWLEANLCKIFDKGSYKLEKILLTKNQSIKNSLNKYNA